LFSCIYAVKKLLPSKVAHNSEKIGRSFFLAVEIKPSILAYISAPLKVRKQLEIFCLTLAGLMSLSARLSQHLDNLAYPNFFIIPTSAVNDTLSNICA